MYVLKINEVKLLIWPILQARFIDIIGSPIQVHPTNSHTQYEYEGNEEL